MKRITRRVVHSLELNKFNLSHDTMAESFESADDEFSEAHLLNRESSFLSSVERGGKTSDAILTASFSLSTINPSFMVVSSGFSISLSAVWIILVRIPISAFLGRGSLSSCFEKIESRCFCSV